MILLILLFITAYLAYQVGMAVQRERNAIPPHEREWGSGKDLTGLLPLPAPKLKELEAWYEGNQTKDAQIKQYQTRIQVLEESNRGLQNLLQEKQKRAPVMELGPPKTYEYEYHEVSTLDGAHWKLREARRTFYDNLRDEW